MPNEIETKPGLDDLYTNWSTLLKQMDSDAWDLLLRSYADDLRQDIIISLRKRGLPDELADDIAQETWVTAIRKISTFTWENERKFYHWLRVISLNHIHTYRRMMGRYLSIEDMQDNATQQELDEFRAIWHTGIQPMNVEDHIIQQEQLLALDKAMRTLNPQECEILVRWLLGETPRELALNYKLKARSISVLLLRAKKKIEANLTYLQPMMRKDKEDE